MTAASFVILLVIGIAAGILGGMVGVGGGIIIVPALVLFLGLSQHEAQGTSLAVMLPPIGILAVMNYYKQGYVNFKSAAIIAAAFIVGGYIGSKFAVNLPQGIVKKIFGAFMMLVAIKLLFGK